MPAKMQERGTTIDSCSLEIWEQKLKILGNLTPQKSSGKPWKQTFLYSSKENA